MPWNFNNRHFGSCTRDSQNKKIVHKIVYRWTFSVIYIDVLHDFARYLHTLQSRLISVLEHRWNWAYGLKFLLSELYPSPLSRTSLIMPTLHISFHPQVNNMSQKPQNILNPISRILIWINHRFSNSSTSFFRPPKHPFPSGWLHCNWELPGWRYNPETLSRLDGWCPDPLLIIKFIPELISSSRSPKKCVR